MLDTSDEGSSIPGWIASLTVLVLLSAPLPTARAQGLPTPGTCAPAQAEAYLNVGAVRARILNDGGLFFRGQQNVYEVPKGSGIQAVFNASLWMTGKVGGNIRSTASTYGLRELWPGPIPPSGGSPTDCAPFDRLWSVKREDLLRLDRGFGPTTDIVEWPWHLGAPVTDGDGDPSNYDLAGGDRPRILGDQAVWTVMNDRGNGHPYTNSTPLGIEVRMTAAAFSSSAPIPLDHQTIYYYRLRNQSDQPILEARVGLFVDADLGYSLDDYFGTDSGRGLGYFYNADDFDEDTSESIPGYGNAPPATGVTILRGPTRPVNPLDPACRSTEPPTRLDLSAAISKEQFTEDNLVEPLFIDRWLQGRWANGSSIFPPGRWDPPPTFMYDADPVRFEFWTEVNADGSGATNPPGDRRIVMGVGPFCLAPGAEEEFAFAVVYARGSSHLQSVARLRALAESMRNAANDLLEPVQYPLVEQPLTSPSFELGTGTIHPNPASERATMRYSVPHDTHVRIDIHDALGRELAVAVDATRSAGEYSVELPVNALGTGVYLVRMTAGRAVATQTLVVVR